jgi:class 3 adenylate cyclase
MVEVTFTVSPRIRHIEAHQPDRLPPHEYMRQIFWGSGFDIPDNVAALMDEITLDSLELPPGEKATMSLQLPSEFVIVFDPVTHATQFLQVEGEPTRERRNLSMVLNKLRVQNETIILPPGPIRIAFENRTDQRTLPALWIAGDTLHHLLGGRRPFLTAKRLLTNQTFRDLYRTDALDIDQRLKITSLTFLFTDLKGSTALYDRVGDLVAYDLVRAHFQVLHDIVADEAGAVVKTIGDAVMATFATPEQAVAAALRMRDEIRKVGNGPSSEGGETRREDLLLKIGIHEGPCLAVMLNDRQDYFGQTVNIAARVQALADSRAILATGAVMDHPETTKLLEESGVHPVAQRHALRGVTDELTLYALP